MHNTFKSIRKVAGVAFFAVLLTNCGGGGGSDSSSSSNDNVCGIIGLNDKSAASGKIINGVACDSSGSPVVEVLLDFADGTGGLCSGTMLDSTHVLTAGHCFEQEPVAIEVDNGFVASSAASFVVHPQFSVDAQTGNITNDVAIVELSGALPLPTLPILRSREVSSGDELAIYGYGKDNDGNLQVLRAGEMEVTSTSTDEILAVFTSDESDTCNGDSGGPALAINNDGVFGIAGITSTGTTENCTTGDQSLFTNTFSNSVFAFIQSVVPDVQTN